MTRLSFLFALATAAVVFSAEARKATTFHTAFAPSRPLRIINRRMPPHAARIHGGHHAPAPAYADQELAFPPEPYPGFFHCLEKLTDECGAEILWGIFGKDEVSAKCCGQLVGLGRRCHKDILSATLSLPEMAKLDKKKVTARDLEIWSQCVFVTNLKVGNSRLPILP